MAMKAHCLRISSLEYTQSELLRKGNKLMDMQYVSSSAISAVGYDERTKRMTIVFTNGRAYDFCGVPHYVYLGLMTAASKGQYYNAYIRDRYQCF